MKFTDQKGSLRGGEFIIWKFEGRLPMQQEWAPGNRVPLSCYSRTFYKSYDRNQGDAWVGGQAGPSSVFVMSLGIAFRQKSNQDTEISSGILASSKDIFKTAALGSLSYPGSFCLLSSSFVSLD